MRSLPSIAALFLLSCAGEVPLVNDAAEPAVREEAGGPQSDGWMAEVNARIKDASRQFVAEGGGFVAEVPERKLTARFDGHGAHITPAVDADAISIRSISFGRRDNGQPLEASPELGECQQGVADPEGKCIPRLEYAGPGMTEWWVSQPDGFEQGWQIAERPDGVGPVQIDMQVDGADATVTDSGIWLQGDDGSLLIVSRLAAWDANGDEVEARFERTLEGFRVVVEDAEAEYPIEVDPYYSTSSWEVDGVASKDGFAYTVAGAGDVNGDGYDDVLVGAYGIATVYLFEGSASGVGETAATTLTEGAGNFGTAYAGAGDVNNDGYDDVIVGDSTGYQVYIFHGGASGLDTTAATTLTGTGTGFGSALDGAGDTNGDGYADVIVGEYGYKTSSSATYVGRAYIYEGSASGVSSTVTTTITGAGASYYLGWSVAGTGDVNNDGYTDVVVGAYGYNSQQGRVYVHHGSASAVSSTAATTLTGESTSNRFGYSVDGAGDVDGDGYDDVIIGAYGYSSSSGRAYVYIGSSSGVTTTGVTTFSGGSGGGRLGYSVAGAGDVNDDGYADVIVGMPDYGGSGYYRGIAFVHTGSLAGLNPTVWDYPGYQGYSYVWVGTDVAGVGDTDGDGYDDVAVAGYGYGLSDDPSGGSGNYAGRVSVDRGGSTGLTRSTQLTGATDDELGSIVDSLGDVNGDGYDDVLVTAPGYLNHSGRAAVYTGSSAGLGATPATNLTVTSIHDYYATGAAGIGDVNGDGYDDLAVGSDDTLTYVHLGSSSGISSTATSTLAVSASSIASRCDVNGDGYDDLVTQYTSLIVYAGSASGMPSSATTTITLTASLVACAGDVNNDGYDDVLAGHSAYSSSTGRVYLLYGSRTGLPSTAAVTLSGYNVGDYFGDSAAGAGDVNGDGYDDVVIGAHGYFGGAGRAYVYHGSATGLSTSVKQVITGSVAGDSVGYGVSGTGDVDGDGYDDIVVTAPGYATTGAVRVFPGSSSGISTTALETISSSATLARTAGDVDGDGIDDLILGDAAANDNGGSAYLYGHYIDADGDGYASADDCDDTDPTVTGPYAAFADADADGYGDPASTMDICGATSGYVTDSTDCDDGEASIHPGSVEGCDAASADEDCDGYADDNDPDATGQTAAFRDADSDGYGGTSAGLYCDLPAGWVATSTDCNDGAVAINPGATEVCDAADTDENCNGVADEADATTTGKSTVYTDSDSDGYGGAATAFCDVPASGYVATSTDCNDGVSTINPGAIEVCDAANTDEDCDGYADDNDPDATGQSTTYRDSDGDGYGGTTAGLFCDLPTGWVATSTDCNDSSAAINPAGAEGCDAANTDEDCDGHADDNDPDASGQTAAFRDTDSDGYGGTSAGLFCDLPTGWVATSTDCNDSASTINPGATEVCDAADTDEDCNGAADDPSATGSATYYADSDSDGYGGATSGVYCEAPSGYVATSTDCDDSVASINPLATEVCDAADTDENCDGLADDATATGRSTFYTDADGDGYGSLSSQSVCDIPAGYAVNSTDCDDDDGGDYPGATETVANEDDEDCDGTEVCHTDGDADGYRGTDTVASGDTDCSDAGESPVSAVPDCDDNDASISSGAEEIAGDELDSDCDGGEICYLDADSDGYRADAGGTVASSDSDCNDEGEANESAALGDCNDEDATFNPGIEEGNCADPNDYNCDGSSGFADADGDGFAACEECDDARTAVNPDAEEVCNGRDDDCDGDSDGDASDATEWYADADGDSYVDLTQRITACDAPEGYLAASAADCNDADVASYPGAAEVDDDGIDQDCDGSDSIGADVGDTGDTGDTGESDSAETRDTATDGPKDAGEGCECAAGTGSGGAALLLVAAAGGLLGRRRARAKSAAAKGGSPTRPGR